MRLSASDPYRLYKPSSCELRLYLHHKGVEEKTPSPFGEVIRRLGERHEQLHLATFEEVVDLTAGTNQERRAATLETIHCGAPVIYQALFGVTAQLAGRDCEIVGAPDFLIENDGAYIVRDAKLARRIDQSHPEISGSSVFIAGYTAKLLGSRSRGLKFTMAPARSSLSR